MQDRDRSVSILNIGRLGIKHQCATIHILHRLSLATFDLLACVIATRTAAFGGLDALAIKSSGTWRGFSTNPLTIPCDKAATDPLETARYRAIGKIAEHCAFRKQVFRVSRQGMPPRRT